MSKIARDSNLLWVYAVPTESRAKTGFLHPGELSEEGKRERQRSRAAWVWPISMATLHPGPSLRPGDQNHRCLGFLTGQVGGFIDVHTLRYGRTCMESHGGCPAS